MLMNRQSGFLALMFAIIFGALFVGASVFGFWAFGEMNKYKNDTEEIVADAVTVAVDEAETTLENEFVEREKLPTKKYVGPTTYGSVTFDYPKTWSIYEVQQESGIVLNLYGHPKSVREDDGTRTYALRLTLTPTTYDNQVKNYESYIDSNVLKATPFRLKNVQQVLGTQYRGEIRQGVQGLMTILPLRDRSLVITSESDQFFGDYTDIILDSLTFVP